MDQDGNICFQDLPLEEILEENNKETIEPRDSPNYNILINKITELEKKLNEKNHMETHSCWKKILFREFRKTKSY